LSKSDASQNERGDGDKIIIIDRGDPDNKTVKKVLIITPDGKQRKYEIKRTAKGGYLFN